jgi:hypothetical protein
MAVARRSSIARAFVGYTTKNCLERKRTWPGLWEFVKRKPTSAATTEAKCSTPAGLILKHYDVAPVARLCTDRSGPTANDCRSPRLTYQVIGLSRDDVPKQFWREAIIPVRNLVHLAPI